MQILLSLAPWVGCFLLYLSLTKLFESLFFVIDSIVKKTRYTTTLKDKIVTWLAISYLLTAFTYLVS